MSAEPKVDGEPNLKPPAHLMRSAAIAIGALAIGAALWGYSQYSSNRETSRMSRFDAFRAAYSEKCNVPSYAGPVVDVIRDDYLTSQPIQAEVDRQLAALKAGSSCNEVVKKLKAVDFAVPAPGPA